MEKDATIFCYDCKGLIDRILLKRWLSPFLRPHLFFALVLQRRLSERHSRQPQGVAGIWRQISQNPQYAALSVVERENGTGPILD
jgi:hypothetical protein